MYWVLFAQMLSCGINLSSSTIFIFNSRIILYQCDGTQSILTLICPKSSEIAMNWPFEAIHKKVRVYVLWLAFQRSASIFSLLVFLQTKYCFLVWHRHFSCVVVSVRLVFFQLVTLILILRFWGRSGFHNPIIKSPNWPAVIFLPFGTLAGHTHRTLRSLNKTD